MKVSRTISADWQTDRAIDHRELETKQADLVSPSWLASNARSAAALPLAKAPADGHDRAMVGGMSNYKRQGPMIAGFTPGERDYIRRGLDRFFSTLPTVAEGFMLKTWRGGPDAGKPKLPPAARTLVERGLMRLEHDGRIPRLLLTESGMAALREMMSDRRLADPARFGHVRRELGIDPPGEGG